MGRGTGHVNKSGVLSTHEKPVFFKRGEVQGLANSEEKRTKKGAAKSWFK